MAERRMISKTIVFSDDFLDMPLSARCLYFTFLAVADDDGFVNNPRSIIRQSGAVTDDLKILVAKDYVIPFESGVIVIKHWKIHNYIQSDRYKPTLYQTEKNMLVTQKDKSYALAEEETPEPLENQPCIQSVSKMDTQVRLGKVRLGKDSIDNTPPLPPSEGEPVKKRFKPPTKDEVQDYCDERSNGIDAEAFVDFYQAKNWYIGKNKMKDWKATVRTWERRHGVKRRSKEPEIPDDLKEAFDMC